MSELPLSGVRVVEVAHIMAGPICGLMLSDMGADVVKVERLPSGDGTRGFMPPGAPFGESPAFMMLNRGKRSVALDLRAEEGKEVRRRNASIDFQPSDRAGVFRAVGLEDPNSEAGYVWARIEGQTMRVNSLTIDDRGRYTLQVYKRTLTGGGMDLDFVSIQEDEPQRTVRGRLVKVAN